MDTEKEISACPACNECPRNKFEHSCRGYYRKCEKWLYWFYKTWGGIRRSSVSTKNERTYRLNALMGELKKAGKVK